MARARTDREITSTMRHLLIEKCSEEYGPILEALVSLAVGVKVRKFNEDGKAVIYDRPPDIYAIREIHDRMFGKAPQAIAVVDLEKVKSVTDLVGIAAKTYGIEEQEPAQLEGTGQGSSGPSLLDAGGEGAETAVAGRHEGAREMA